MTNLEVRVAAYGILLHCLTTTLARSHPGLVRETLNRAQKASEKPRPDELDDAVANDGERVKAELTKVIDEIRLNAGLD